MKEALHAAAQRQGLTESALLKRMLGFMLQTGPVSDAAGVTAARPPRHARLYVRLSTHDGASLRERAAKRSMAPATYAANVLRAHLQGRAQLLNLELAAVKDSAGELRSIGVNLNQIAHLAHSDSRITGPTREDLRAFLKVCGGLRDHIAALVRANAKSWGAPDV